MSDLYRTPKEGQAADNDTQWRELLRQRDEMSSRPRSVPALTEELPREDNQILRGIDSYINLRHTPTVVEYSLARRAFNQIIQYRLEIGALLGAAAITFGALHVTTESDETPVDQLSQQVNEASAAGIDIDQTDELDTIAPSGESALEPAPENPETSPEKSNEPTEPDPVKNNSELVKVTDGGIQFNVATFNILHIKNQGREPKEHWQKRARLALKTLNVEDVAVAMLQEVRPPQLKYIKNITDNTPPDWYHGIQYKIHPGATSGKNYEPNIVLYSADDFKLTGTDKVPFLYFGASKKHAPLVELEHKSTGTRVDAMSGHDPADVRGEADWMRAKNAEGYVDFFKPRLADMAVATMIGSDFNSPFEMKTGGNNTLHNNKNNHTYCVLTRSGLFYNSYDVAKNVKNKDNCPSSGPENIRVIDHIYVTTDVGVKKYKIIAGGEKRNGSDHRTIVTYVVVPRKAG